MAVQQSVDNNNDNYKENGSKEVVPINPGEQHQPPVDCGKISARKSFWYGIANRKWWALKVFFFFKYGAMGALFPYIVVYYRARHLSPSQIGIIECIVPFLGAIARPISAMIADKTQSHKLTMAIAILVNALLVFALIFVSPPTEAKFPIYQVNLSCHTEMNTFTIHACNSSLSVLKNVSAVSPIIYFTQNSAKMKPPSRRGPTKDPCLENGNTCHIACFSDHPLQSFKASVNPLLDQLAGIDQQCAAFQFKFVSDSSSPKAVCHNVTTQLSCHFDCHCSHNRSVIDNDASELYIDSQSQMKGSHMFLVILALRLLSAAFFTSTFCLEDAITYDMLGPENRCYWGQQKMFGPLSFGIIAIAVGLLIDVTSNFNIVFYATALLNGAAVIVTFVWIPQPKFDNFAAKRQPANANFCAALRQLCRLPLFAVACFVAIASGVFIGIVFVIWPQWVLHLGASTSLIGITTVLGSCVEASGLFFSGQVVAKFGQVLCFLAMFLAYALRFLVYSFFTPALVWVSLPLELMQLFCFSFFLGAMTQFAAAIAPRGMSATVQSVFQACFFGIGLGIGNLSMGAVYEKLGGALAFKVFAAGAFVCFVVLLILHLAFLRFVIARSNNQLAKATVDETIDTPVSAERSNQEAKLLST